MIYSCILRYILVNSGKFRYLQESIPVHQRIYISTALSLTIWTGRKLGGLRQQIQIYDLGIKSDCLTIRPLWYCMLESKSRVSHLRLGFVLPLGKCSLSTPSIGKDFIEKIGIIWQWERACQVDFKKSFGYMGCQEYQWI